MYNIYVNFNYFLNQYEKDDNILQIITGIEKENFQKAVDMNIMRYTKHHNNVAVCYGNIGLLYLNKKDYDQALKNYQAALEIRKVINNPADTMKNYAEIIDIYLQNENYSKAKVYLGELLIIAKKTLGEQHELIKEIMQYLELCEKQLKNH